MKFVSFFSGIEGIGYGFEQAGMECVGQVENDPFCNNVRTKHYPDVPQYGDIKHVKGKQLPGADVFAGGFPCQDLSVAGHRAGLGGSKSSLWWQFARVIEEACPRWLFIENVPGLLSSGERKDMGILLGKMAQLGYWWSYRVLNAEYYGVAQRRRRLFIVANSSDLASTVKVLFEPESCDWDTDPRRKKEEEDPRGAKESVVDFGRTGDRIRVNSKVSATLQGEGGGMGAKTGLYYLPETAHSITTREGRMFKADQDTDIIQTAHSQGNQNNVKKTEVSETLDGTNSQVVAFEHRRTELNEMEDLSPTLNPGGGGGGSPVICFQQNTRDEVRKISGEGEIAGAIPANPGQKQQNYLASGFGIRRLTPLECTRLQGFPDDYLEVTDANAKEARSRKILHKLWRSTYKEADEEWEAGIYAPLLTPEILLSGVHVGWVSWELAERCAARRRALQGENYCGESFLRSLRFAKELGYSPYRRKSFEQCVGELGGSLSELPYHYSQGWENMLTKGVQSAPQGTRLLQQALHKMEEMGGSEFCENPPKSISDTQRYKMLGNAVPTTIARWVGERMMKVHNKIPTLR